MVFEDMIATKELLIILQLKGYTRVEAYLMLSWYLLAT